MQSHPSQAGLTAVRSYGFLLPFPEKWREHWEKVTAAGEYMACVCPKCVGG